jgi:hypothetical protein
VLAAVGVLEDEAAVDARAPEGHVPVLADVLNGEQMANGVNTRCTLSNVQEAIVGT